MSLPEIGGKLGGRGWEEKEQRVEEAQWQRFSESTRKKKIPFLEVRGVALKGCVLF